MMIIICCAIFQKSNMINHAIEYWSLQERSLQLEPGREHFIDLKVNVIIINMSTLIIIITMIIMAMTNFMIVCSNINILTMII